MPFDVGRADCDDNVCVCEKTELGFCIVDADIVIVLGNLLVPVFGGMTPFPPPLFGTPGVVVTTATLHNVCIARPNLNSPMMLSSGTSSCAHCVAIRPFTLTRPVRQDEEHVGSLSVKSLKLHPGMALV
jgi:hypothetical protein